MAKISNLKDKNDNDEVIYPITKADATYMNNGKTVERELDGVAYFSETTVDPSNFAFVNTNNIVDKAVTPNKLNLDVVSNYEHSFTIGTSKTYPTSYTTTKDGLYLVIANLTSQSSTTDYSVYLSIEKNQAPSASVYQGVKATCFGQCSLTRIIEANTGDTIDFSVSSTVNIAASTNSRLYTTIIKIG